MTTKSKRLGVVYHIYMDCTSPIDIHTYTAHGYFTDTHTWPLAEVINKQMTVYVTDHYRDSLIKSGTADIYSTDT